MADLIARPATLEVPVRTRCADCNRSLDAVKARIERHFEERGTAQRNALTAEQFADDKRPRHPQTSRRRHVFRRVEERTEIVVKESARVRMQRFSRELEARLKRKAQRLKPAALPIEDIPDPDVKSEQDLDEVVTERPETLSPPMPDCVPPATIRQTRSTPERRSFLRNDRLIERVLRKLEEKRHVLPPLCGCRHGVDPLDAQYSRHCCQNCPLFANTRRHEQLLRSLLRSSGWI